MVRDSLVDEKEHVYRAAAEGDATFDVDLRISVGPHRGRNHSHRGYEILGRIMARSALIGSPRPASRKFRIP
jgi:hypothetical protein